MPNCKIERSGNLLKITPGYKALLERHLRYERRQRLGADPSKCSYKLVHLYREESDGSLVVPSGLLQRVYKQLKAAGIEISYHDYRELKLGEPQFKNLDPLRGGQDDVLAAVVGNDQCIIEAPTGFGKTFIIKQICKLYPDANIIICSPFTGILKQLYSELKELWSPDQIGFVGDGSNVSKRITCVIDKSLMKADLANCDIFIFDEIHRAASPGNSQVIASIQNAKMIGFSASPTGRSDRGDLETIAMFGEIIHGLSYQQVQATGSVASMEVYIMPTCECPPLSGVTGIRLNRWGLWRNKDRNKLIQEAVTWCLERFGKDIQILISVETVEHAVNLGALLPDFTLVYGQMDAEKRIRWERSKLIPEGVHPITSNKREQYRQEFREGKIRRAIATSVWGTGVDFPGLNVLIRADAASGEIPNTQIPGRATRVSEDKKTGIIVDFNDSFCKTLNGRFIRRCGLYKKKGWKIQLIKPTREMCYDR